MKKLIIVWALLVLSIFAWSEIPTEYKDREILTSVSTEGVTGITLSELFDEREFIEFEENGQKAYYKISEVIYSDTGCIVLLDLIIKDQTDKQIALHFLSAGTKFAVLIEMFIFDMDNGQKRGSQYYTSEVVFQAMIDILYYDVSVPID